MPFQYRVKYYSFEEGEYTDYQPCDLVSILELIKTHWLNESSPNNLEVISIANESGEHLLLEHFRKDIFEVYWLPTDRSHHYHKKSYFEIIPDAAALFFSGDRESLRASLNMTRKDNKYIRGDYFFIDHNYRYTKQRSLQEATWMLWIGLPVLIMTVVAGFKALVIGSFFLPMLMVGLLSIYLLPGIALHLQYRKDIGSLEIYVTKGNEEIRLRDGQRRKTYTKKDVLQVTKHENPNYRSPWSDYGYTQIEFKTGEIVNLSNLLLDQWLIDEKFQGIRRRRVKEFFPSIGLPTRVEWGNSVN